MEGYEILAQGFETWEWWAISGLAMLVLEVFAPGAIFLWPGLAAMLIAILAVTLEPVWQVNVVVFSVLSFVFAYLGRGAYLRFREQHDHHDLNKKQHQLVGKLCTVAETTNYESGRVKLNDGSWLSRCDPEYGELSPGSMVEVISVEGTTLIVKPK